MLQLLTCLALLIQLTTGRPIPQPAISGMNKETKMKILETLLNDDTQKKKPKVENNIHLNISPDMYPRTALSPIQGYQPPQVHLPSENIVQYHAILPSPLPAPNLVLPSFQQHQVNTNNILDSLKLPEKSANEEDEDDLLIKRFFPDLPFADFSKLIQLLKQIAQDDSLSYEKKQSLFDTAFSFLPRKKQSLGKHSMAGIVAALNNNLGEDEIPPKYRLHNNYEDGRITGGIYRPYYEEDVEDDVYDSDASYDELNEDEEDSEDSEDEDDDEDEEDDDDDDEDDEESEDEEDEDNEDDEDDDDDDDDKDDEDIEDDDDEDDEDESLGMKAGSVEINYADEDEESDDKSSMAAFAKDFEEEEEEDKDYEGSYESDDYED